MKGDTKTALRLKKSKSYFQMMSEDKKNYILQYNQDDLETAYIIFEDVQHKNAKLLTKKYYEDEQIFRNIYFIAVGKSQSAYNGFVNSLLVNRMPKLSAIIDRKKMVDYINER